MFFAEVISMVGSIANMLRMASPMISKSRSAALLKIKSDLNTEKSLFAFNLINSISETTLSISSKYFSTLSCI